jgi:hypothetical protein
MHLTVGFLCSVTVHNQGQKFQLHGYKLNQPMAVYMSIEQTMGKSTCCFCIYASGFDVLGFAAGPNLLLFLELH